jgi:hypothetical protein
VPAVHTLWPLGFRFREKAIYDPESLTVPLVAADARATSTQHTPHKAVVPDRNQLRDRVVGAHALSPETSVFRAPFAVHRRPLESTVWERGSSEVSGRRADRRFAIASSRRRSSPSATLRAHAGSFQNSGGIPSRSIPPEFVPTALTE